MSDLKPCPFCGAIFEFGNNKDQARHPTNSCLLSAMTFGKSAFVALNARPVAEVPSVEELIPALVSGLRDSLPSMEDAIKRYHHQNEPEKSDPFFGPMRFQARAIRALLIQRQGGRQ